MFRLRCLVPMFMRTWPGLRRYYWQAEELADIHARAKVRAKRLGIPDA